MSSEAPEGRSSFARCQLVSMLVLSVTLAACGAKTPVAGTSGNPAATTAARASPVRRTTSSAGGEVAPTAFPSATALPANVPPYNKQRVTYQSSDGTPLVGYIYRPNGPGPFPTLVWNHGSEANGGDGGEDDAVAAVFVPVGYAVVAPERRGQGEASGTYIQDALMSAGAGGLQNEFVRLMSTQQLADQLAGLALAKTQSYVDATRLGVIGCSYGGIQTLVGATADAGYKVAVALSPGAESWDGHPVIQQWLVGLASKIDIPVFIIHPAADASLEPGKQLSAALQALGKPYQFKIYPPHPSVPQLDMHCFGPFEAGTRVWGPDAIDYLDSYLRRR